MLHFRTILLWLAFILLVLQNFIAFNNLSYELWFRLVPSGILLLWFLLSIFIKEKFKINLKRVSAIQRLSIIILRPSASLAIITGAVLKLLHLPYGNTMLVAGIGFMAVYSTILSQVSTHHEEYDHEIIDDVEDDQ
jgi:hypothetical protein